MAIHLRSPEELGKMHRAGIIVWEVLTALRQFVRPGLTTMDLETFTGELIAGKPGHAAFKGYRGYPCALCTSVNSEIVHGIPSPKRKLREGDIVSIDFGMEMDGYYADSAVTVPVGEIRPELNKLLHVTREALDRAIEDRKSTRLNSSHANISYAVFCLKKKKITKANRGASMINGMPKTVQSTPNRRTISMDHACAPKVFVAAEPASVRNPTEVASPVND